MLQQGGSSGSATPGYPTNGSPDVGDVAVTCGIGVLDDEPSSVSGDEPECTSVESDPMLSPSGKLLITRVKGPEQARDIDGISVVTAAQSGYAVHLLSMGNDGSGWTASTSEVAQLCVTGGKPVISFDERWMVLHHYVTDADATDLGFAGVNDPAFAPYRELGARQPLSRRPVQRERSPHHQHGRRAIRPVSTLPRRQLDLLRGAHDRHGRILRRHGRGDRLGLRAAPLQGGPGHTRRPPASQSPLMVHSPSPRKCPTVRASEVTKAPKLTAPRPDGS
jgi:hypothetical protein